MTSPKFGSGCTLDLNEGIYHLGLIDYNTQSRHQAKVNARSFHS